MKDNLKIIIFLIIILIAIIILGILFFNPDYLGFLKTNITDYNSEVTSQNEFNEDNEDKENYQKALNEVEQQVQNELDQINNEI